MIADLAEAAMANTAAPESVQLQHARVLVTALSCDDANLVPDPGTGARTMQLPHWASRELDAALAPMTRNPIACAPHYSPPTCA